MAVAGEDEPPWRLSADRIEHRRADQELDAQGSVVLERLRPGLPPVTIQADSLRHYLDENVVEAEGNVTVTSDGPRLTARRIRLDLDRETGIIEDASIFLPTTHFYFTGKRVEKTGPFSYRFENGSVTACPAEDGASRAWRIVTRQAELTLEGYARLHGATLRIKEIPVFYTPYLLLPAKTVRATGFLFPEFTSSGRDGTGIVAPFFIDLSPSADLTLYPGFLEKRGVTAGLEARLVASRRSRLTLRASFLHDTKPDTAGDDFLDDGYFRATRDRYWLRGKGDAALGPSLHLEADLDLVSDRDFLREYRDGPLGSNRDQVIFRRDFHRDLQDVSLPFRESSVRLRRTSGWGVVGVEALAVKDVWDEPRASTPLQVLPRGLTVGAVPWGRVVLDWDGEFVNYWRYDGVGTQRLDLLPRLGIRLPLGAWLDNRVSVGLRQTLYRVEAHGNATWPHGSGADRTAGYFGADLAVPLARTFHPGGIFGWQRLVHVLRPAVAYRYVAVPDQADLPDLDAVDRLEKVNMLEYGVTNVVRVDSAIDGAVRSRRLGRLRIRQWYDIAEARRSPSPADRHPFSDILVELDLAPTPTTWLAYETTVSVHGQGVTGYDLAGGWRGDRGDSLRMDYRYQRDPNREFPYFYVPPGGESSAYLSLGGGTWLGSTLRLEGNLSRSLDSARTVSSNLRLLYSPTCWNLEMEFSHGAGESRLMFKFGLEGLGRIPGIGFSDL